MVQRISIMKYFLSFLALLLSYTSFGQVSVTSASSCTAYTLTATVTGLVPTSSGITADDGWSGVIPIGFTYNFYGAAHTQCIIGSNGELGFDLTNAGAYNTWPISATLAGTASGGGTDIENLIAGPWCDIYIPAGGTIMYSTVGAAPNRKFEVTFCATHMYDCTAQWVTTQIIIYETTGVAEVHIGHHTFCTVWNGGYAEVGVVNSSGSSATVAPGRDYPSNWNATNEAWRFTPVGTTSFTVSSIPYAPIPYASSAVYWYDSATHAYIGTGTTIVVTPSVTTTYMAAAVGCQDTTFGYITVAGVGGGTGPAPHISGLTFTNPTACGLCNGTVTLHGLTPGLIDTVFHALGGVAQPNIVTSAGLDSTITITGLCGGFYNYFYVKVGNCPSNQLPATLVTPVLAISHEASTNPSVCGECNGSMTLYGLTPGQPVSVAYQYNGVPQPAYTGTVAGDSSVTISGLCAGNYTSIAATVGLCTAPGTNITITNPAPFPASFYPTIHLGCNGDTVFLTNTSLPTGYSSYWSFGDGTPIDSTDVNPIHVYSDQATYTGSYNIVLTYESYHNASCATTFTVPVSFDHPVVASFTPSAYTVCIGTPITYANTSTPLGFGATYQWNFGDGTNSALQTPTNTYGAGGVYNVTLTVTDTVGCSASTSATIDVVHIDIQTAFHDTNVCLSIPLFIPTHVDTAGTFDSVTYRWTPPTDLNNYTLADPSFWGIGTFTYTVEATAWPLMCQASDVVTIHSFPPITITNLTLSPQSVAYGSSIQLNADGALYYFWTPDNGSLNNPNINNPIATPTDSLTIYTVFGMSEYGCKDSAKVYVYVDNTMDQFIPTAFTPNNDGLNDVFRVSKLTFQKLVDFRVYNRWGALIFQTADPTKGWDGTYQGVPEDMGVYSYEIIVGMVDGTQKVYKGNVTLIR